MLRDLWKPFLMAGIGIAALLYWGHTERIRYQNDPCESFANERVDRLPARCLRHYSGQ